MNDKWKALLADVSGMFGWHGGMGDPPDNPTMVAIVKGALEHVHHNGDPDEEKVRPKLAVTVWKDGTVKFWNEAYAKTAEADDRWLVTIPLTRHDAIVEEASTDSHDEPEETRTCSCT